MFCLLQDCHDETSAIAVRRVMDHSRDDRKPIIEAGVFPLHFSSIGNQSMIDSKQPYGTVDLHLGLQCV